VNWRIVCLLLFVGCSAEGPRSAHDTTSSDVAPDTTDQPDQPDSPDLDTSPDSNEASSNSLTDRRSSYEPSQVGLCAGAPVDLFGKIAWVSDQTLWLAPHPSTGLGDPTAVLSLGPTASARSPVVLVESPQPTPDIPVLALAVDDQAVSTLHILDLQGNQLATITRPGHNSIQPLSRGGVAMWPLHDLVRGAGHALIIALDTLSPLYDLELPGVPITPALVFGPALASGGGSHWVIGTDQGLVVVADRWLAQRLGPSPTSIEVIAAPPTVIAQHELPAGRIESLLVLREHLLVGLANDDGQSLQLFRFEFSGGSVAFTPVGAPVVPPGPITAHPVGFACNAADPLVTWYCPRDEVATIVTGGDGWLNAYHVLTGTTESLSSEPLVWTGLTLGRGGWVAGGGSHWLPDTRNGGGSHWLPNDPHGPPGDPAQPPGWQLWAVHRDAPDSILDFETFEPATSNPAGLPSTCVPSPLWDTSGTISTPVSGLQGPSVSRTIAPEVSGGVGVAVGSPRPFGGLTNSGAAIVDPLACADGVRRYLDTASLEGIELSSLAHAPNTSVAYGSKLGQGYFRWLPGPGPDIEALVQDTASIEHLAVLGPAGQLAMLYRTADDQTTLDLRGSFTALLSRTPFSGAEPGIVGFAQGADNRFIVATWPATLLLVEPGVGTVDSIAFDDAPNGTHSFALVPHVGPALPQAGPGSATVAYTFDSAVVIRRVDATLDEVAAITDTTLTRPAVVAATTDGLGHIRVIVEDSAALESPHIFLWHFDADLERIRSLPLHEAGPMSTLLSGDSLVAGASGLFRIGRDGDIGLSHPARPDLEVVGPGFAAIGDGFMVAYRRLDSPEVLLWGRSDALGFTSCAQAGACINENPDACDGDDPCLANGCDAATGACIFADLPFCPSP
jgi:hypothetical protein